MSKTLLVFLSAVLMDQYLSQVTGFSGVSAVFVLVLLFVGQFASRAIFSGGLIYGVCFLILIFFHYFLTGLSANSCGITPKGAFSTLGAFALILMLGQKVFFEKAADINSSYAVIFSLVILIFLNVIGLLGSPSLVGGPYKEPSHIALYAAYFFVFILISNPFSKLNIFFLIVTIVFAPTTTMLVIIVASLATVFCRKVKHEGKSFFVGLFVFLLFSLFIVFFAGDVVARSQERIASVLGGVGVSSEPAVLNLSSLVWLNGWSQLYDHLVGTNLLGVGFNQMGCGIFVNAGSYTYTISTMAGGVLNYNDGSFVISKLGSEFGVLGLLVVLVITFKAVRAIFDWILAKELEGDVLRIKTVGCAAAIAVMVHLYIRGGSYFAFSFVFPLALLLISRNLVRKVKS